MQVLLQTCHLGIIKNRFKVLKQNIHPTVSCEQSTVFFRRAESVWLCSHIAQVCVACSLNVSPSHPVFLKEETMEALTAEYEEEVEEEEDDDDMEEEESAEAPESEAALDEQQWSGEEPEELDSPQAEPLEQEEAVDVAQDVDLEPAEAASAAAENALDREEEEEEEAEGEETGVSYPLLSLSACQCTA